eukprot:GFUD01040443.1.p1 GENE.GFUD01040443.1~~GFUD01040443.1.p1  ORF type:complete len:143 (-),score=25.40 GFUD01040443.1:53-481(-)
MTESSESCLVRMVGRLEVLEQAAAGPGVPLELGWMSRNFQSNLPGLAFRLFFLLKQEQHPSHFQLQLDIPIMTRRNIKRKNRPPETAYTMAEVMDMETEFPVILLCHIHGCGHINNWTSHLLSQCFSFNWSTSGRQGGTVEQ